MRRLSPSHWLLLLAGLAVGWLLLSEIEGAGLWGGREIARGPGDPSPRTGERHDGTGRAPTPRARLRGLPGIQLREVGRGRIIGAVHLHVPEHGARPLPGVDVEALSLDEGASRALRAQTGEDGTYAFDEVPAGAGYTIHVRHPPWREIRLQGIRVPRDRTVDVGTILLGAPTRLRGEVVDAAGRPVPGAEVQVVRDTLRPGSFDLREGIRQLQEVDDPLASGLTARDGSFLVLDVPPGRYVVRVAATGYATAFRDGVWIGADEHAPSLRVVLDPGAGWTGRVTDESGRPVRDARVVAVPLGGASARGRDRVEASTDAEGRYELLSLIPGVSHFVEAWAVGRAPTGRIAVPSGIDTLDFCLELAGRVAGRVFDAVSGEGVPDAEVALVTGPASSLSPLTTYSASDGTYAFEAAGVGPVMLFAVKATGYPGTSFTFSPEHAHLVVAGETTVLDAPLEVGTVVRGRVLDSRGRPIPYATVAFVDPRRRLEGEDTALSSADGSWEIAGLRETTYEVQVRAVGYAPLVEDREAHFEVRGPGPVSHDFVLDHGSTLGGEVRTPEGARASGARVSIAALGGRRTRERLEHLVAVTGANGVWQVRGVPPGIDVAVKADHDDWAPATSAPLRLAPGEVRTVDLQLGAGLMLEGQVLDPGGRPIPQARLRWGVVRAEDAGRLGDAFRADQLLSSRVVRSDEGGRFEIPRLVAGRYVVKAECEGYAPFYRHDVQVEGKARTPLSIVLDPAGTIQGRVIDAVTGRSVAGAWVYARALDPDEAEGPSDPGIVRALSSGATDTEGRYVLDHLPPGRYEVVVWLANGYRASLQARDDPTLRRRAVPPGATGIDFRLEPLVPSER